MSSNGMHPLGRHVLFELYGCDPGLLKNVDVVRDRMVEAARRAQATIVAVTFHKFNPIGVSGVVVISTSHMSIHTWPEHRYAAVDIFSCGDVVQPQVAIDYLTRAFLAERVSVVELHRGVLVDGDENTETQRHRDTKKTPQKIH